MKKLIFATLAALALCLPCRAEDITITLTLDAEQSEALAAYVAEWNGEKGTATAVELVRDKAVVPFIQHLVDAAYTKAVQRLGEQAKKLPYEQRKALIQQVEAATK